MSLASWIDGFIQRRLSHTTQEIDAGSEKARKTLKEEVDELLRRILHRRECENEKKKGKKDGDF